MVCQVALLLERNAKQGVKEDWNMKNIARSSSVSSIGAPERQCRKNGANEVIKEIKIKFLRIEKDLYSDKILNK